MREVEYGVGMKRETEKKWKAQVCGYSYGRGRRRDRGGEGNRNGGGSFRSFSSTVSEEGVLGRCGGKVMWWEDLMGGVVEGVMEGVMG